MKIKMFLSIAALALAGCAEMISPSQQDLAKADCGKYPDNYKQAIDKWIHDTFFDPYSVRDLEISKPVRGVVQEPPLLGGGRKFGYTVDVSVNAKNRLGGYTGRQRFTLLIRNGVVIDQGNPNSLTGY
jgi:hypothetical protein